VIASNARSATVRRRAPAAAVPTPRRSTAPFGEPRLSSKYPASRKNSFEALPALGVQQLTCQLPGAADSTRVLAPTRRVWRKDWRKSSCSLFNPPNTALEEPFGRHANGIDDHQERNTDEPGYPSRVVHGLGVYLWGIRQRAVCLAPLRAHRRAWRGSSDRRAAGRARSRARVALRLGPRANPGRTTVYVSVFRSRGSRVPTTRTVSRND
jgi:hypothetical protein